MAADGGGDGPAEAGSGTTSIDERIAARRAQVRRDRRLARRRRTFAVAITLLVLVVLVAVERSPLVGLERVEIVGVDRVSEAAVRDAAQLALGTSTLRLRLGAVEERITELPLIRTATARRLDPLSVRIEVEERQPALQVSGDDDVLLDREGVVLGPADGSIEIPSGVVPVEVVDEVPAPGERPEQGSPLDGAVRTWRGLSGPLRVEVASFAADAQGRLTLQLQQGTEVRWGAAERTDEKVRALGAVLEDLAGTSVEAIDVTAPGRPAVEP